MKTVLHDLMGSRSMEWVLLYLYHYGEGYGRGISKDLDISLESVQRQLDKLEANRILVSKKMGRTIIFSWNEKSRVTKKLQELVAVAYDAIPIQNRSTIFATRRRPRSKDKPD